MVAASLRPILTRTVGLAAMLRTYPAWRPCSATIQNVVLSSASPLPTGLRHGLPVVRPMVSSSAWVGGTTPNASAAFTGGLTK